MGATRKKGRTSNIKPKYAKHSTSLSLNPKEFMAQCVNHIARKIIDSKDDSKQCTPRGFAEWFLR
jgi:hypothetical protein